MVSPDCSPQPSSIEGINSFKRWHEASRNAAERPTDRGADERGGITDVVHTLLLDEVGHGLREVLVVSLHVILQDQATEGASGFI